MKRICYEKALNIQKKYKEDIILSADTIVTTSQKIFGKPQNKQDAIKTLKYFLEEIIMLVLEFAFYIKIKRE